MPYVNKGKKPTVRSKAQSKVMAKNKRWYVNASATLPFVGKTSFAAGSGLAKRSLKNQLQNLLLENKTKLIEQFQTNALHNTIYTLPLLSNIPIGTGDASRLSDRISVKSIRLNMYVSQRATVASTATASFWRVLLLRHSAEYGSGSDAWVSGLGSSEIFQSGTTVVGNGIVDYDKCTVLQEKWITLKRSDSAGIDVKHFTMEIFNIEQIYNSPTSNYGKQWNYYCVVIPQQDGSTAGTTQVGYIQCNGMVTFVDGK